MEKYKKAVFAGGCFWCIEDAFHGVPGVIETMPGYTGGKRPNPTYEQVCTGKSGHFEAVQVTYDPAVISYEGLLKIFFSHIDPTDKGGQFADRGEQYRTAVFYSTEEEKDAFEHIKKVMDESRIFDGSIETLILPATEFYPAEEYHRGYHLKNPERYCSYKNLSGRADFIKEVWGE